MVTTETGTLMPACRLAGKVAVTCVVPVALAATVSVAGLKLNVVPGTPPEALNVKLLVT
mgnify:CR=1 FL=1